MNERDKKLLEVAGTVARVASEIQGTDDIHARYNSKKPGSLGVLMEWYYSNAGQALVGNKFQNDWSPHQ